jgi:hypothetical protein
VTDQPMDYRDWLIRQQQKERVAQRFEALFTKDEDHAAAATQGIENLAYQEAHEAAAVYDDVQESLTDVITQTRDLRAPDPERHRARAGRAGSCSATCASSTPSRSPRSLPRRAGTTARRLR